MNIHPDILDRYDSFLAKKTRRVEMISTPGYTYPHLRWMIEEIRSGRVGGEKAHRWLGFIQGVLIREDHFKVNEERNFTRPYFNAQTHVIAKGETLSEISRKYYGDPTKYDIIAKFNNIPNVDFIVEGDLLVIPPITGNNLKTIYEHDTEIRRLNGTKLTGVACPNCGNELQYMNNTVMLTSPGQKDVKCYSCGHQGRIYV